MKIKFPEAEKFIAGHKAQFIGKTIVSFDTEYKIKEVVFIEGEVLVHLIMTAQPDSPLVLYMDIARAAELAGINVDWAKHGFKIKKEKG